MTDKELAQAVRDAQRALYLAIKKAQDHGLQVVCPNESWSSDWPTIRITRSL